MKKVLAVLLAVIMVAAFAACAKKETAQTSANEGTAAQNYDLILATGGTGGSYYPYGGAMATIFSDNIENVGVTSTATGASAENARLLNKGEADLAILQNDVLDYAFNGVESFAEEGKLENLATIAILYPEVIQIVVAADSGIETIEDFAGKRISVGAPGSGTEANARQILETYGITYDDFQTSYLSFAESSSGVQNRTLDGFFCTAGVPNPSIMELNAVRPVKVISVAADNQAALIEKYPFYANNEIAEDVYGSAASTVAVQATLACRADLDEEVVYNITKVLFEKQAELAAANSKAESLSVETALNGASVPLHPGAERYYKEINLIQ